MTEVAHEGLGVSLHVAVIGERTEQSLAPGNTVEGAPGLAGDL